jgi:putative ABC transport system permease protein
MESTIQDIRYSLRRLIKRPVFSIILVITLGLSIGVNIAVYSLVNTLLIKGLPYANGDQLMLINRLPMRSFVKSPMTFEDWKSGSDLLDDAAMYGVGEATLLGGEEPQRLQIANVSANFFEILGVAPREGRGFLSEEEMSGKTYVALISERLWRSQFGGDSSVNGKAITLNREQYSVIGVVPASSDFPAGTDVWTPTAFNQRALVRSHAVFGPALARVKPGVTIDQVNAQQTAWLRSQNLDQEADRPDGPPLTQSLKSQMIGELKRPVLLLLGAVILVLLIGCANVANLLVADSVARDHEFAIRRAVGMSKGRLFRQLIVENLLIGFLGGLAGLVMAYWSLPYLRTYLPEGWPRFASVSIDAQILFFTLIISVLVGVALGLVPYWRLMKGYESINLAVVSRSTEPLVRRRWREVIVGVETSLVFVLLVAAALFIQTLRNIVSTDYGFSHTNVLAASVSRENASQQAIDASRVFYSDALAKLNSLPGIQAVGGTDSLPTMQALVFVEDARAIPEQSGSTTAQVSPRVIAPGYFRAMGISLLDGRDFDEHDGQDHEPVAIVDKSLADNLWPGRNPVGQQIAVGQGAAAKVVGVVGPVHSLGETSDSIFEVYQPLTQSSPPAAFSFVLRTTSDPERIGPEVRSLIRSIDSRQPIDISTMDSYLERALQRQRGITGMLSILSILALVLAIVGVYGLVSYTVASRTREFGIRIALGERTARIFLRSISSGIRATLPGIAMGILLSLAASKLLQSELFGVKATDGLTLTALAISLTFVATLAGILAARRATSVDPIKALREE